MKKIVITFILLLFISFVPQLASAEMEEIIATNEVFNVIFPMETGAVGFWFPTSGAFAAGVSHTFMRISHSDIESISLDFDGTIAQEVNQDKDTLGGIGVKFNFDVLPSDKEGFTFLPSIGVTALNNFAEFKKFDDIMDNYEVAVYGTLLLYRW